LSGPRTPGEKQVAAGFLFDRNHPTVLQDFMRLSGTPVPCYDE
jgi:hypothetical protein